MHVGPYEISLRWNRRLRLGRKSAIAACTVAATSLLTLVAVASPASAGNVAIGSVSLSSSSLVSVTISTGIFQYSTCFDSSNSGTKTTTVQFPNGVCTTPAGVVTVTNGAAPAEIDIQASSFLPSDGTGTPWSLCIPLVQTCSGGILGNVPGPDQYTLANSNDAFSDSGWPIAGSANCDQAFQDKDAGCDVNPGDSASETLQLMAPSSSTDLSSAFSNTVTWTAVSQ